VAFREGAKWQGQVVVFSGFGSFIGSRRINRVFAKNAAMRHYLSTWPETSPQTKIASAEILRRSDSNTAGRRFQLGRDFEGHH